MYIDKKQVINIKENDIIWELNNNYKMSMHR